MRLFLLLIALTQSAMPTFSQSAPFKIVLEPVNIPGLPGIQSYAVGQAQGKWLIIGGRRDGLHMRQPFGAFRPAGRNINITVVDPFSSKVWESTLSGLSRDLQDQLSSTNMQYYQEGRYLYIAGGYGFSDVASKFVTYDKLTAVDVFGVIQAVVQQEPLQPYFRQIADTAFAVTGGHLKKIGDTYLLVGGQKFLGRYNPMGPDHGPGFVQHYTEQIRKFKLIDDGVNINISAYGTTTDAFAFHRRDYNVVPQITANETEGITAFSGVFQQSTDIPFLNAVNINADSYSVDPMFAQYYNHYHCAVMPVYSKRANEMHNIFFGGIAQYYDSAGTLVQNNEVPFVKTISRVTRDRLGKLAEYKLPVEMPVLSGAGSEFILLPSIPQYANKTIKLDELNHDTTLVGHIYGGIVSSMPNIFFINTGDESKASSSLYKVYLVRNTSAEPDMINHQSDNGLQLQVFPDAHEDLIQVSFKLAKSGDISFTIENSRRKLLKRQALNNLQEGQHTLSVKIKNMKPGDTFWFNFQAGETKAVQKINIEE